MRNSFDRRNKGKVHEFRESDFRTSTARAFMRSTTATLDYDLLKAMGHRGVQEVLGYSMDRASSGLKTAFRTIRLSNGGGVSFARAEEAVSAYLELYSLKALEEFFVQRGTHLDTFCSEIIEKPVLDTASQMQALNVELFVSGQIAVASAVRAEIKYPVLALPQNAHLRSQLDEIVGVGPGQWAAVNPDLRGQALSDLLTRYWPELDGQVESVLLKMNPGDPTGPAAVLH